MNSQEKLFHQLNKMLTFYLKSLKLGLIPLTILLFAVAVYWGLDLNNARKEVKKLHSELSQISTDAKLTYREFILSNKELSNDMELKYSILFDSFDSINSEFEIIANKSDSINKIARNQLSRNNELYQSLLSDSKSLDKFSKTIINEANIGLKNIKKEYHSEIEFAKMGADEKLKLVDELYEHNLKMFSVVRKLVILNTDISLLTANMSKFWANSTQRKLDEEKLQQINQKVDQINKLINDEIFIKTP
ncbi:MAG: hypothetical protein K8R86_12280 [Bacteroidales bacterium]|nr:hypothetical protein [Bacteroidales bacterium]